MKFTTEKIRGIEYNIEISAEGSFFCTVEGAEIKATTLDALKKKLTEHSRAKQKNISVQFVYWDDNDEIGKLRKGICVGIHAGNNNLLVRFAGDNRVEQFTIWWYKTCFSPKDAAQLEKLQKAVKAAQNALEEFRSENSINLRNLVQKELEK